jgi:hypothetical protein
MMNRSQALAMMAALEAQAAGGRFAPLGLLGQQANDLIKAIDTIGYQTPLTPASGSNLSPLVPQFLDPEVRLATVEVGDEVVLLNDLKVQDAAQTVAEFNRLTSYGQRLHPFFAEGSAPGNTQTAWDKQYVKIAYLGRRGEVTDVANQINNFNGYVNQSALEIERQGRVNDLMLATEEAAFFGTDSLNPLSFKGVIQQINAGGGYNVNKAGAALSLGDIQDYIRTLAQSARAGKPRVIYADIDTFGILAKEIQESPNNYLFRDQVQNGKFTLSARSIEFVAQRGGGMVQLKCAPRLQWAIDPPTSSAGEVGTSVTIAVQPVDDGALPGTSQWVSGDAGAYSYKVVPVYKKGAGAAITSNAVTVGAGDKIKVEMSDVSAQSNASNPLYYYDVFRTDKDGTTYKRIMQVAVNTSGAGGGTRIIDLNALKYNASKLVICDPYGGSKMGLFELLPTMLRPLAQVETTVPFLVQRYCSPVVYVPEQAAVIENFVMS